MKRIPLVLLLVVSTAQTQVVPPDRRIEWGGSIGIPGGIPNYPVGITATDTPFNADKTGAADATAAINAAIEACPADKAVLLPAGLYRVEGTISLKRHCVLRGMGTNTVLKLGDTGYIQMKTVLTDSSATDIQSGMVKGSTTLTVANSSAIGVGEIVTVDQLNDPSLVDRDGTQGCGYCSREAGSRVVQFVHLVTAKNGNTLTIDPPLPYTLSGALQPQVYSFVADGSGMMEWAGVEDLKLHHVGEASNTDGNAIEIRAAKFCWVRNVEIQDLCEAGVYLLRAYRCEVRHSYLHHAALSNFGSGRAYGVTMWWGSSYNLIEDNICYYLRHSLVIEGGGAGNVFGYNYSDRMFDQYYPGTDYLMGDLLLHGSHPMMNLYEGNVARVLYFDNVHGSGSHNTAFRNWLVGESQGESVPWMRWSLTPVGIDQNHLSNNIVGNVLGKASHGPGIYDTNYIPGAVATHYAYILGQRDRANLGVAPGWDEVRNGLLRHFNWDFNTAGIRYDSSGLTSDMTLPESLYLPGKPAFFGSLAWPPFDPRRPDNASVTSIPAGFRFINGKDPTGPATPQNFRILGTTP